MAYAKQCRKSRAQLFYCFKDALQRAQDHQEKQANRRRRNHKFKDGGQVLFSHSARPADKLRHSTSALLHCWNNTRQSPSVSSCRRSTRFTTFSTSISSDHTCDPQKHLVLAWRRLRTSHASKQTSCNSQIKPTDYCRLRLNTAANKRSTTTIPTVATVATITTPLLPYPL